MDRDSSWYWTKNFRKRIVQWSKIAEIHDFDFLKHSKSSKNRTVEERYELVARVFVFSGESQRSVAINAGIDTGLLSKWVQIYKIKQMYLSLIFHGESVIYRQF